MAKKNSIGDVLAATLGNVSAGKQRNGMPAGTAVDAVSESDTSAREQIEYIPRTALVADEKNFYSIEGIDDLAANIELIGLQQPLRVRPVEGGDGLYLVVSGHRRRAALDKLALDGNRSFEQVPCIVERDDASPAMRELRLIYANSSTRTMSSADLAKQAERVTELLYRLKEEGVEFPGRMRDHVAEACKISTTKLATLKVIREKLIPKWTKQWEAGKLNESAAYTLAKLPKARQALFWDAFAGQERYKWQTWRIEEYAEKLDEIKGIDCRHTAGGGNCARIAARERATLARDEFSANYCAKCCDYCPLLAKCKYACPKLSAKVAELKAAAKEERKQEKERAAAIVAPRIELNARLWKRAAEARKAAGLSTLEYMRLTNQYAYNSQVDAFEAMERGEKKLTENSETPFNYVLSSESAVTLVAMADKLGVSLDYLLCRTDDPTPPKGGGA